MTNTRRMNISEIQQDIKALHSQLETHLENIVDIRDAEEEYIASIPKRGSDLATYEIAMEALNSLDQACEDIQDAMDTLETGLAALSKAKE